MDQPRICEARLLGFVMNTTAYHLGWYNLHLLLPKRSMVRWIRLAAIEVKLFSVKKRFILTVSFYKNVQWPRSHVLGRIDTVFFFCFCLSRFIGKWLNFVIFRQCDRKKLPNIYKSCPKMILLNKWKILTHLEKLPKNVGILGEIIFATGFKMWPKVQ